MKAQKNPFLIDGYFYQQTYKQDAYVKDFS